MKAEASGRRGKEIQLNPDELIVSKTDPTGHITYANRVFMRIAGYAEHELLGRPHNLIRHADMPRGVFRLMWKTLQGGGEFFGVVKNTTKHGDYYWVMANVTPDFDSAGQLQGYYSVRRRPSRQAIDTLSSLYARMLEVEASAGKARAPDASADWLAAHLAGQGLDYETFILRLLSDTSTAAKTLP
ncbi:PAS domain-containing protein [Paludibacterium paludis]|uniref:Chemotaxis protein n=1 Tax=Paludibacterium paludis TaxID=1225769 RepID=A0A918P1T5_9NEIS|nr:PAS domain-containing protein [Paludibacterium paludis]GGY13339.1 chemotaxis protein [Paludibacterium paludis]